MSRQPDGYLALLLHAHLPFVRHPEHDRFLEEMWFFEAVTETYLPLLIGFETLARDGVDFRIAWSFSPTLVSMLEDELLQERYQAHLERRIELAEKEVIRLRHDAGYRRIAEFYADRFRLLADFYLEVYRRDLVQVFRRLQDTGHLEILTTAATHGFLPFLRQQPASVRAQLKVAVDHHRAHFGRAPRGIWLPECGYYPGLDEDLAEAGLSYFFVEGRAVLDGRTRARYGVHAPIVCPTGVAAFGRDPECSRQVWSTEQGFPGDPDYRDFYRDIGFDLPLEYIGPYIGPDGVRTQTGIKYHRITGPTDRKEPYDRRRALARAAEHARRFAFWREQQAAFLIERMDRRPVFVAPYDAELFGHWWFEGPEWIHFLLRAMVPDECSVLPVTPSEYLAEYPEGQVSVPEMSSWGHQGYYEVWLNDQNDWMYPRLHQAASRMSRLAHRHRGTQGLPRRALNQAARELMLAQASDWSFILRTGTSTGYAERRVREHLDAFDELAGGVEGGEIDARRVAELEERNNVFPELGFEVFDAEPPVPAGPAREPLHVVFLVAECAPLVKVGGLGDVAGALPAALAARGARVTVILPAYRTIDRERHRIRTFRSGLEAPLGSARIPFRLLECQKAPAGVRLLLVDQDAFFGRDGVYVDPGTREEYPDTAERFVFFTRAALESLRVLGERVDVVHSHDHQTAFASAYLRIHYRDEPLLRDAASVYTLHNLGYQGIHPPEVLDAAGFGRDQCYVGSYFEYFGKVNSMKVGICFADKISTVSETYAREICSDETQSAGLAPVIRTRGEDLVGILNGIDVDEWDPSRDPHIPRNYCAGDLTGKRHSKRALLERAGLDPSDLDGPVLGMVSRLVEQKGLDLIEEALADLLSRGIRFVVLGTGVPRFEKFLLDAARRSPRSVAALIRFDNALAHLCEAGLDFLLMPSLYEPCGLNQMYSLRYGTVPVVRATGGLADTVPDADEVPDGVGFAFREYSAKALVGTVDRALAAYRHRDRFLRIQREGMKRDFSWNVSAERYLDLYRLAGARQRV